MTLSNGTLRYRFQDRTYRAGARSVVVLIAGTGFNDATMLNSCQLKSELRAREDCDFEKLKENRNANQDDGSQGKDRCARRSSDRTSLP